MAGAADIYRSSGQEISEEEPSSSGSSIRFGIVFEATEAPLSAVAVMPGTLAISAKGGAFGIWERSSTRRIA